MVNPDKHIRKAFYDLLNGMEVGGYVIRVYDTEVTGAANPMHYILMHSQTKEPTNESKCGYQWDCTILLDVITRFTGTGNPGSRLLVNDIEEEIFNRVEGFALSDLFSIEWESSVSADIKTNTENMFRQLIRYRIIINN